MTTLRSIIKILNGPHAGRILTGWPGEGPDVIIGFLGQYTVEGMFMCKEDDGVYLPGDHIYKKVSRSELFDKPEFTGSKHVMPGCAYEYSHTPEPNVEE